MPSKSKLLPAQVVMTICCRVGTVMGYCLSRQSPSACGMRFSMNAMTLGCPLSLNLIGEGCHYKEGDLKRRMGDSAGSPRSLLIPA